MYLLSIAELHNQVMLKLTLIIKLLT